MIKGSLLFRTAAGLTIAVGILREVFCPTTGKVSLRTPSMHCASLLQHCHCERSEAIQNPSAEALWIASSQELLAMTEETDGQPLHSPLNDVFYIIVHAPDIIYKL